MFDVQWVEGNRFRCFHYQHREDQTNPSRRCCIVQLWQNDTAAFIGRYDGQRWVRTGREEVELAAMCKVRKAASQDICTEGSTPDVGSSPADTALFYQTRKQKREAVGKGMVKKRGTVLPRDLLPPPGLPQGNVGTPSKRIIELVSSSLVPPSALKRLAVNLSSCSRGNFREGQFNFDWKAVVGDDDDDDAEEWDRVLALEGPVPSHINERADRLECENPLYEENCEQTWEKGSSGLVHYTDDAHWDAALGDFHERTADALDVVREDADAACDWEASTTDAHQEAYLHALQERKNLQQKLWKRKVGHLQLAGGLEKKQRALTLPPALRRGGGGGGGAADVFSALSQPAMPARCDMKEVETLDRKVAGKYEDAFERDVRRGFAGKLCEKMGWKLGGGLGVSGDLGIVKGLVASWDAAGGAGMPVKSLKESRKGIGFAAAAAYVQDDSDDCNQHQEAQSKGTASGRGGGDGGGKCYKRVYGGARCEERLHASRWVSPDKEERQPCVSVAESEEDYVHIGCMYDEDEIALRSRQEHPAHAPRKNPTN